MASEYSEHNPIKDIQMAEKPTYEELEQRVKDLEKEVLSLKQTEKENAKFKMILDQAMYGFSIIDMKGNITYINEYFAKIHGYETNELSGKSLTVFHNEEQLNKVSAVSKALIEKGNVNNEEIWHVRKDGSVFPMLMNAMVIKDENDKPLFFGATSIDITDRKEAEKGLRESEGRYRQLFENSMVGTGLSDKSGRVLAYNDKMAEITGYSRDELSRLDISKTYANPKDREELFRLIDRYGKVDYFETRLLNKQGEKYWVSLSFCLIDYNGKETILTSVIDISKRKQVEETLQKNEERLSTILDASPVPAAVGGLDGSIISFNKALEQLIGYNQEEFIDVNDWSCKLYPDEEYREFVQANINQALEGKDQEQDEFTITCKDGSTKIVSFKTSFYQDGLIIQMVDVTDRVRAEKALQENEGRYRQLFDNSMMGIAISDKFGRLIEANDSIIKMTGYSRDELSQLNLNEAYVNQEDREEILGIISKDGKLENYEAQLLNKQGTPYWASLSVKPIKYKGEDVLLTSATNITERKLAEDELKSSQMRIKAMADSSFEAIILTENGLCLDQNRAAEKMFGYTKAEIVGKKGTCYFVPENRELAYNFAMSGHEKPYTATALRKDGTTFPCEIQARGTVYRGRSIRVASCRDISDRIKAQKITQKEKKDLEKEILKRTVDLEETNTALGILLKKRERDKTDVEEKINLNVKVMIEPYLKKLKKSTLNDKQMIYLKILESNVREIISPFGQRLSSELIKLSPKELNVANLVRQGKTTKEIAALSNVSPETISRHRKNIRKKLNLTEKKVNLRTSLLRLA